MHAAAIGAWLAGDWHACRGDPRRPAVLLADRRAGAAGRPPARLLPRRRPQPARPPGPRPRRVRPPTIREPPRCAGCTPSDSRSPVSTRRPRRSGCRRSTSIPTTCGRSTPSCTRWRCVDSSTAASRSCAAASTTGATATCSPCTTGGTCRCSSWRPGTTPRSSTSTTGTCTTPSSAGVPLEMLDASALLWRLKLDGVDSGTRFAALADAWASEPPTSRGTCSTTCTRRWRSPVPDDSTTLQRVIAKLEADVPAEAAVIEHDDDRRGRSPGHAAVLAFAEDRHDDVVETLAPIRRTLHRFGGSHAQRDVLQRTLLESALRSGRYRVRRRADLRAARPSGRRACTAGSGASSCPRPSVTSPAAQAAASGPPPSGPASPADTRRRRRLALAALSTPDDRMRRRL